MPNERATLNQLVQLGLEVTPGSLVAATKQLQSMMWTPTIKPTINSFRPSGFKYNVFAALGKEQTDWKGAGEPTFGELPYIFSGLLGNPGAVPIGSNGGYNWLWVPSSNTVDVGQVYSVEQGSAERAETAAYFFLTGMNLKANRTKLDLSADATSFAITDGATLTALSGTSEVQTWTLNTSPTGGTFTLTFRGQTTGAIAYTATGAQVQTALLALSTVGTGNLSVSGGAGGPYVITFAGSLAKQPISTQMIATSSLTGGSPNTVTVSRGTPGVSVTPESPAQPVIPTYCDLYLDTNSGALGGTRMTRAFSYEYDLSGKYAPVWCFQQSTDAFAATVEDAPKTAVKFLVEANAAGMGPLVNMRAGSTIFARFQAKGPLLDASNYFQLQIDTAVKITNVSDFKDEQGVYAIEWTGEITHDPAWGFAQKVQLQNLLAAL